MSYALNTTTRKLQFLLSGAATTTNPTCVVTFADVNPSGEQIPTFPQLATANGATAVDICDAPPQDYVSRVVSAITVYNADTATATVTVRYNDNGTLYVLNKSTLLTGETLGYTGSLGWYALDVNGNLKQVTSSTFSSITNSALTNGRVVTAGASGLLADSANLTWSSPALTLGVAGSTTGQLKVTGSTSGTVTVQPAATAGTWSMTLPTTGGTSGYFLQTNGSGVTTWAAASSAFSNSFTSSAQTITSAGALTLAHSLGATPTLMQCRLKCTTAEGNYSVNDEVVVGFSHTASAASSQGLSLVPDATNLNVRFGSGANVFYLNNKTTGAQFAATNTSWDIIFRAWV